MVAVYVLLDGVMPVFCLHQAVGEKVGKVTKRHISQYARGTALGTGPQEIEGTKDKSLLFLLPDPFFLSISYAPSFLSLRPSLNIISSKTILAKLGTSSITVHHCTLFLSATALAGTKRDLVP